MDITPTPGSFENFKKRKKRKSESTFRALTAILHSRRKARLRSSRGGRNDAAEIWGFFLQKGLLPSGEFTQSKAKELTCGPNSQINF